MRVVVLLGLVLTLAGGLDYVRRRYPVAFWLLVGLPLTWGRFLATYGSTMVACGLALPPSRLRAFAVWAAGRGQARPVPPRIRRVSGSLIGLRVRLRLPPGLEPADVAAAAGRLRHAWGVHALSVVPVRPGVVELRMTGYDVLREVRMPRRLPSGPMVVPVALREDGTTFVRDYRQIPHTLTLGANQSGKTVYQRNLIMNLAKLPVALVGIDCKRGVEQAPYAARLSALATDREQASKLLEALVVEMEDRFDLLKDQQGAALTEPEEEVASDIWGLPAYVRPFPVVVLVDDIAELFPNATTFDEETRDRMVANLIRLAQRARPVGIYLEICGQRFGPELGKGAGLLRAQLTGRVVHRVSRQTAEIGLADFAPEAMAAATSIARDRAGVAVAGDVSGGWSHIRTPLVSIAETAAVCRAYAHLVPDLPALDPFRPYAPDADGDPGYPEGPDDPPTLPRPRPGPE
ncbi:FtsK/SpoIIIE domain-containing protein [Streptomyces sp. NPDC088732]|uniref:FtsK/SpoIIIE domain-containing protein n=1 Tax=Streptomyces sp. NPDC088732 TaxID=3365879 RepID=UPI003829F211